MITRSYVLADTSSVDEENLTALRAELASLEAQEARVSAERRRLHQQIDFGYSASDSLLARERKVSDERRDLHRRIDSLRDLLGVNTEDEASAEKGAAIHELEPDQGLERLPFAS